jgi:hypothetical protein
MMQKTTTVSQVGQVVRAGEPKQEQTPLPELYGGKLQLMPKQMTKASTLRRYSHFT